MELNNKYSVQLSIASLPAILWEKVLTVITMWKKKRLLVEKKSSVLDRPINVSRFKEWIKYVKTPEDRMSTITKLAERKITISQFKQLCEDFK